MRIIKLHNGVEMPTEGFGVFQVSDLGVCERAVSALAVKDGKVYPAGLVLSEVSDDANSAGLLLSAGRLPQVGFFA